MLRIAHDSARLTARRSRLCRTKIDAAIIHIESERVLVDESGKAQECSGQEPSWGGRMMAGKIHGLFLLVGGSDRWNIGNLL